MRIRELNIKKINLNFLLNSRTINTISGTNNMQIGKALVRATLSISSAKPKTWPVPVVRDKNDIKDSYNS